MKMKMVMIMTIIIIQPNTCHVSDVSNTHGQSSVTEGEPIGIVQCRRTGLDLDTVSKVGA